MTIGLGNLPFEATGPQGRSLRRTGNLRLATPNRTTAEAPRLQEEWRYTDNGEPEWRDVPTVVVDDLSPRRSHS